MSFNQIENKKAIYYPLRDVAEICTGNRNTQDAVEDGKYIFYVRSPNPLRLNEYDYDDVSVITAGDGVGVGKVFHITNGKYALHQRAYRIHPNNSTFLNPVYLYYYFNSKFYEYITKAKYNSSVASIRLPMLQNFEIPIPPLEVQNEIVKILDKFTELEKELEKELEARKSQYEYYRRKLLDFNGDMGVSEGVRWEKLRDITLFKNGVGHEKCISEDGEYIVVNSKFISTEGGVKKYSNNQISPLYMNEILLVMSDLPNGKALAKCFIVDEDNKYTLNQRIGALKVKDETHILPKYLFYVVNRNEQLLRYDNGCDQTNLRKDDILDIDIPIPTIEEQNKIVGILDKFNLLIKGMSGCLPTEIDMRHQQYEYYREKLLTFN